MEPFAGFWISLSYFGILAPVNNLVASAIVYDVKIVYPEVKYSPYFSLL